MRKYICFKSYKARAIKSVLFFLVLFGYQSLTPTLRAQVRLLQDLPYSYRDEMSGIDFYSPSEGYISFYDWVAYTQDSGRTLIKKPLDFGNMNLHVEKFGSVSLILKLTGVKAFGKNEILVCGDLGDVPSVLRSTDGGDHFELIFHSRYGFYPNSSVNDMAFATGSNTGYLVDLDRIWKTTNRGLNWNIVRIEEEQNYGELQVIDDQVVFAIKLAGNESRIIRSMDGGANWETLPLPAPEIASVFFSTANTGWISTSNKALYYTNDGGKTWVLKNYPNITGFYTDKLVFLNDSTGYALNPIRKTVDSGKHWERLVVEKGAGGGMDQIRFWNTEQFWVGGGGTLAISTNSGGNLIPSANFFIDASSVLSDGTVSLQNYSKTQYAFQWYRNGMLISTDYNASYKHNYIRTADTIFLVASNAQYTDTAVQVYHFNNPISPSITSFTPNFGTQGEEIIISGNYLSDVVAVTFENTPAAAFTIVSANEIRATIANGTTGSIKLKDRFGNETAADGFIYVDKANTITPVISNVNPLAASPGANIVISGKNFGNSAAKNIVYIGAVRAGIVSASTTQITCTLPPGTNYGMVSVVNLDSKLMGKYDLPFSVLFPNPGFLDPSYFTPGFKGKISAIKNLSSHDMDGDGKPDVLAAIQQNTTHAYTLYRNTSATGVVSLAAPSQLITISNNTGAFVLEDFNNDGKTDLLIPDANVFTILMNNSTPGNISFAAPSRFQLPGLSGDITLAVGDLDKDGKVDVVAGCDKIKKLLIYRNTTDGGSIFFDSPVSVDINTTVSSIAVADLTGKGRAQILFNSMSENGVVFYWLENRSAPGTLSFGTITSKEETVGLINGKIHIADMDANGLLDVVVANASKFIRFRNEKFQDQTSFRAEGLYTWAGDYNKVSLVSELSGDKLPELITSYHFSSFVRQDGGRPTEMLPDKSFNAIAVGDIDMDGRGDIIAADNDSLNIYVSTINNDLVRYVCEGETYPIHASIAGNVYQWQMDEGNGFRNLTASDADYAGINTRELVKNQYNKADDSTRFRCIVDGVFGSTTIVRIRTYEPISVTIHTLSNNVCDGTEMTFTADVKGTILEERIEWYINDGLQLWGWLDEVGTSFTTNKIKEGYRVTARYGGFQWCPIPPGVEIYPIDEGGLYMDTSNVIEMHVGGVVPMVDIQAPYEVCAGARMMFIANTNGTTTAGSTFEWTINGVKVGENSDTLIVEQPVGGDLVRVSVTNPADVCGASVTTVSAPVAVRVKTAVNPELKISASKIEVCKGQSVTVVASNKKYDNNQYAWFINNVRQIYTGDTLMIEDPIDGSVIKAVYTGTNECGVELRSESNTIQLSVKTAVAPRITIESDNDAVCEGTPVRFVAEIQDAGANPSITWLINGSATNVTGTHFTLHTPKNNDKIQAKLTAESGCGITEVNSDEIAVHVKEIPLAPVIIIIGDTTIKPGESNKIQATITNGNAANSLQWQENKNNQGWVNIPGETTAQLFYQASANGDMLRCILTTNTDCLPATPVISNILTFSASTSRRVTQGHLYPNPVLHSFIVDSIDVTEGFIELKILSTAGLNQLFRKDIRGLSSVSVSVATLPKGEYLVVMVKQDGYKRVIRFTKL